MCIIINLNFRRRYVMKLSILGLLLLASCGGHKPPKCWTEYKYEVNQYGYYAEKKVVVCEPRED